ncbi:hypothetical protein HPB50_029072 [Hyalomma asiaticum]|nr:hypothetical protein HPB50_029072 [Hyalomma asiaticum]
MQLVELDVYRLHFRTLDVDPKDFAEEDDIPFLCLCLWLLRNHRCITSVSLSVPVVAPRHALVFMSMLRLTKSVVKLEIHGCSVLRLWPTEGSLPPGFPTARRRDLRWEAVLHSVSHLKKLVLLSLDFSVDEDACALRTCVERSASLAALVLIDVDMDVHNFLYLLHVLETKPLRDFRFTTIGMKPTHNLFRRLPMIALSRTLSRLYVHTGDDLIEMIKGLHSTTLSQSSLWGRPS